MIQREHLPNPTSKKHEIGLYEGYIYKSRYARYVDELGRREEWPETVKRYVDFFRTRNKQVDAKTFDKIETAIRNFDVMPSMRALMTAGSALERDNTAGYNCSYLPIDDPKAFDEAMYILMCGTGVGFSAEHKYVSKLPEVPEKIYDSNTTIVVSDSKEGWAKAFRQLLALLWAGEAPKWDVSKVRPSGARLKTFGGRASGPEPLIDLFHFAVMTFKKAAGRKLTPLECHDMMCKVGEIVVVGGVRRSAMISLSDLGDYDMAKAKAGNWWEKSVHRALANNSAVYETKPDVGQFMREWTSIYESFSGERGIFNREAAQSVAARNGRRKSDVDFGTNPCSEIILRPYQFCNLTEVIVRSHDTIETLKEKVNIATLMGTLQSTLTNFPYLRKIWKRNTEEERLLGVSMTGIYDNPLVYKDEGSMLEMLRQVAVDTNEKFAEILGVPQSAAITCVKPSGTVSQLCDTASGIHPRYAPFYIRRVRGDNKDPLTQFMIQSGIPNEPDVTKPDSVTVFSFPKRAPEGAITREGLTATQHLKDWLKFSDHWCEHKVSATISVKPEEWPEVGAWVWQNFDEISGVSFLPWDGGTYRQAPYEEITEEKYLELEAAMPKQVNWENFHEETDLTEGAQTLACVAGICEV